MHPPNSHILRPQPRAAQWHRRGAFPHAGGANSSIGKLLLLWTLGALCSTPAQLSAEPLPSPENLDGVVLTLGPTGAAVRQDGGWDGAFGADAGLYRVRESSPLTAIGIAVGGFWFSERTGGRGFAELSLASNALGLPVGISAGPAVELDRVRTPRWGGHTTIWAYLGVVPYIRLGHVEKTGSFIDIGLRIPLPTLRWDRPR